MFTSFILGLAAGWGAPYAEPMIRSTLEGVLPPDVGLAGREWTGLALALCLLAAAIVSAIVSTASGVPLALGALLGVLAPALIEKWRGAKTPDYDS